MKKLIEWQEIYLDSSKNGFLYVTEKKIEAPTWIDKISQVDTIPKKNKSSKWLFLFLIMLTFLSIEIFLIYFKEREFYQEERNQKIHESEKYIELIDEALTSELEYIIKDARQYWKTINFIDPNDLWKIDKIFFFQNDKYLYYGVYKQLDNEIYSKLDYYNTEALSKTNLQIDQLAEKLEGIEPQINRSAREGIPLLLNLSDEKTNKEICMALVPVGNTIVLGLGFYFEKWNEILSKREYGTYILLNHQGIVLAHSNKDTAKNAPDYSQIRFFDFLKDSSNYKTRKEFFSSTGKTVHVYVRKILPIESYLIYLFEYEKPRFDWKENYVYFLSFLIFVVYSIILIRILK